MAYEGLFAEEKVDGVGQICTLRDNNEARNRCEEVGEEACDGGLRI